MKLALFLTDNNTIYQYLNGEDRENDKDITIADIDEKDVNKIVCGSTKYVDGQFNFSNDDAYVLANSLRHKREVECFSIINRGTAWYNRLTEQQKSELDEWYQAWLDAPQTGVEPERLEWL